MAEISLLASLLKLFLERIQIHTSMPKHILQRWVELGCSDLPVIANFGHSIQNSILELPDMCRQCRKVGSKKPTYLKDDSTLVSSSTIL